MNKRGLVWWIWLIIILATISVVAIIALIFSFNEQPNELSDSKDNGNPLVDSNIPITCASNYYNCGDFSTCKDVMEVFNACSEEGDIHGLDKDGDGIPCASLCQNYEPIIDPDTYTCQQDTDCIKVKGGYCGCGGGGTNTAINSDYEDYWNSILEEQGKNSGCPAVMSDHWTCFDTEVKCLENRCEITQATG